MLPRFSLIKALFGNRELNFIERVVLSVGLSLAIVTMSGVLLNYTPWGMGIAPVTVTLLVLTLMCAFAGVVRDFGFYKK